MIRTAGIKILRVQCLTWALPLLISILTTSHAFAQAPNISYSSPKVYQPNTAITPLLPTNTGGAVPPTVYGTVSTFAGSTRGYLDALGTSARFSLPGDVAADLNGNIYVADRGNSLVRKITPAGVVSTFAGTYFVNGATDGPGTSAKFDGLSGITFDGTNLYVAESQNGKVRKIDLSGNVSTYIGKPNVASTFGGNNGDPQTATFNYPWGMAFSSTGNLFIADYNNYQVRKYVPGGQVSTFAGTTTSGFADAMGTAALFKGPIALAINASNDLYVTDMFNHRIRKITSTGDVFTFAGNGVGIDADGTGTAASIKYPNGITIDPTGNLYVSGQGNMIRRINPSGIVTTVAGSGVTGSANGGPKLASFNNPAGMALDRSGNLYVADGENDLIRKIIVTGYVIDKPLPAGLNFDVTTGAITGTPTAKSPATIYVVTAFNAAGSSSAIITIKIDDAVTPPSTPTVLAPAITYRSPVTYYPGYKITDLKPANTGGAVPAIPYGKTTTINIPGYTVTRGIAADGNGNIYFTDYNKYQIIKVAADGTLSVFAGDANASPETKDGIGTAAHFYFPLYLATDAVGNIYETESNLVRKINIGTALATTVTGAAATGSTNGTLANARFNAPQGIDADAAGNTIYIADGQNNLVRKVDLLTGTVSTLNTSGESLQTPVGVAYDAVSGNVYVSQLNGIIKKITPAGAVSTFAGSTTNGRADGQGILASFSGNLGAMAVDQLGNLYVSDAGNNLVRKITVTGLVSTLAGSTQGKNDGVGAQAQFYNPYGITSDKNGFVYITDNNNVLIRKISTYGYTIDKALPAGLTFDPSTGIISGIPTSVTPAADYTVTAFNGGGVSSYTIRITVAPVPLPVQVNRPVLNYSTPNTYFVNIKIPDLTPNNSGGPVPATLYGDVTTITDPANNSGSIFNTPVSVAVDNNNVIYVADNGASQVKKIVRNTTVPPYTYTIITLSAVFNHPTAVAADAVGNVYIADQNGSLIRRMDADGNFTVYAGTTTAGYLDGPALSAQFNQVSGMVTDIAGNLYVADLANGRIRKVTQAGLVSTVLTGLNKPSNIVLDEAKQIMYFTEYGTNRIRSLDLNNPINANTYAGSGSTGNADGQLAVASFNGPYGLALDPTGNMYIADEGNFTVRRADINDKTVVIIAGNNIMGYKDDVYIKAQFTKPGTIVFDHLGNLILTDGDKIRNIVATGYTISGKNGEGLPPTLTFDPRTGIISGTPGVLWSPTDYVITAYNAGGSSVPKTTNIQVINPGFSFPNLPAKTVCDIGTSFNANATTNKGTPITYQSSDPSVATIDANGLIRILKKGKTDITATNENVPVTHTLTVAQPVITVTITKTNTNTCESTKTDFTAGYTIDITNVTATYSYAWKVNNVDVHVSTADFSSATLKNTDIVTCTVTACFGSGTKDMNLALVPIRAFTPMIQASITGGVCPGTPVTYSVLPLSSVQQSGYQWQVNGQNVGSNNSTFTSGSLKNGDRVTCIVSSVSACLNTSTATSNQILVSVLSEGDCVIKIPNAFTPNGDGINDSWKFSLPAAVNFKVTSVKVYSRAGTLVYRSAGYDKPWDGTMNGQKLPVSTYYYIVESEDRKRVSGNVTIIR